MDTITHGLLGAALGQACFSRQLGRHALVWGAAGGMLPDLDVVLIPFFGRMAEFEYHRGFTHAFWFGPVIGVLLGYATWRAYQRWERARGESRLGAPGVLWAWMALWVITLFSHPLLDMCTSYGTQFYTPFSDTRVAWDAIGILDPFYTVWLIGAVLLGWCWPAAARNVALAALFVSTSYLIYGFQLNRAAEAEIHRQLSAEGVEAARINAYPTLLQPYLRRAVARHDGQIRVGYLSMWRPHPIAWAVFPESEHPLAEAIAATPEGQLFTWFAMEQTHAEVHEADADGVHDVIFHDLRYGFPQRPEEGMWGIHGRFHAAGEVVGAIRPFSSSVPTPMREMLLEFLDAAFPRGE